MNFIKNTDWQPGIRALRQSLVDNLSQQKQTLWLVTGGSNIPAAVSVMETMPPELTKFLSITLTDERYGPVGHSNSNWQQLLDAGFEAGQAKLMPVLIKDLSLEDTRESYEKMLGAAFEEADVVIGQFGMGSDGHISGILPHSSAVEATSLITAYETPELIRITTTFTAIRRINIAYLFVFGDDRRPALETLQAGSLSLDDQPAQILHELSEAYVFNNQIGDPI